MESGFSEPQRQSQIGIVVMFFHTLQQYARALWPVLLVGFFKLDQLGAAGLVLAIGALIFAIGVIAYLQFINFTFYIDDSNDEFIINEGIINKSKTVIQLNKIQQVNITQSLIQRLVSVYALDVDTAGSTNKEGKIKAVSHAMALALKARLLDNDRISSQNPETHLENAAPTEIPFITISFASLLKHGITSNYIRSIGLIIAFFATIYENINSYSRYTNYDGNHLVPDFQNRPAFQLVMISVCMLFIAVIVINLVRTVVKYYNFEILRQGHSLLLSFGLLNTKSTIIKPEKVQITSVSRNYFQKKMNIVVFKIKQATSGEKEERKSAIEIPGCNELERDAILKLLFEEIPMKGDMMKPNFRKLGFSLFLILILPVAGYLAAANLGWPELFNYSYIVPIYSIFVLLIMIFSFRNYRIFVGEKFIIKQSGAWDISQDIIQIGKIQALSTSQLFWHKGIDIGTLTIHTAGGNIVFQLGNFTKIKNYVNLWLYELETSDSNWM